MKTTEYSDEILSLSFPSEWEVFPLYCGSSFTLIRKSEVNILQCKASITIQHFHNVSIELSDIIDNTVHQLRNCLGNFLVSDINKSTGEISYSGQTNGVHMRFIQKIAYDCFELRWTHGTRTRKNGCSTHNKVNLIAVAFAGAIAFAFIAVVSTEKS
jgi:hypothetical protein